VGDQCPDDADMGEAARRPTAEGKSDHRPAAGGLVGSFLVLASSDPVIQHAANDLLKAQKGYREKAAPARMAVKHGLCRA
jgi:hypothetical protein